MIYAMKHDLDKSANKGFPLINRCVEHYIEKDPRSVCVLWLHHVYMELIYGLTIKVPVERHATLRSVVQVRPVMELKK